MTPRSFDQIDHPLIVFAQVVLAIALFRLFFAVRRSMAPLPQIIAVAAFSVLANLSGRVMSADWFVYSDIVIYWAWAATAITSVFTVIHRTREQAKQPGAPVLIADFFDRWQVRATWMFGLIAVGFMLYSYLTTYEANRHADTKAVVAADSAVAVATKEYSCQQEQYSHERRAIMAGVASVSAVTMSIASGMTSISATQQSLLVGQKKATNMVAGNGRALRKAARTATGSKVNATERLSPKPASDGTIKRQVEQIEIEPEKKGFWKRIFGRNSPALTDSLQQVSSDTLSYRQH